MFFSDLWLNYRLLFYFSQVHNRVAFSHPGLLQAAGVDTVEKALERVAKALPGVVGVTLGPDGFLWRDGSAERRVPAPRVTAVDTLAACDVWHGAFALALGERMEVSDSARFANAAAAIKCTRHGGRRGAPTRAEVEVFLTQKQLKLINKHRVMSNTPRDATTPF